jgi:hypothetical protein
LPVDSSPGKPLPEKNIAYKFFEQIHLPVKPEDETYTDRHKHSYPVPRGDGNGRMADAEESKEE